MAENENAAAIANIIANHIFKVFHWELHSQNNADFECVLPTHKNENGVQKQTHPGDVVFYYLDPYLNKIIYLHTDLKSYSQKSIQAKKIRDALNSLAMTVECAHVSRAWNSKFKPDESHNCEVRGLLFVANHDNKATKRFGQLLKGISKTNLPIAKGQQLHVLGPVEITSLFCVATDIKLLIHDKKLSPAYRFFYPDQTLWKRQVTNDTRIGATIEMLMAPHFILKHSAVAENGAILQPAGSIVYYAREGSTVEEFVYLLDCFSRYQLVQSNETIRIRAFHPERAPGIKNNFDKAKRRYCNMWGFEGDRAEEIMLITIEGVQQTTPNYVPDEIGWK